MALKQADVNTEEKIKEAARKLFVRKGFAATKTRDIATEAGINLALLNYYFRSKEKLFDIIMLEHMVSFMQSIGAVVNNETTDVETKIEQISIRYIDMFLAQPDIPLFILGEIQRDPTRLLSKMDAVASLSMSVFMKQIMEAVASGKFRQVHPLHIIANLVGMTVFPFIGKPLLKHISQMNDEQYTAFVEERKKLIPQWVLGSFKT